MLLKRLQDLDELHSTLKPFFTITKPPSRDLNQLGILVLFFSWLLFSFEFIRNKLYYEEKQMKANIFNILIIFV